ncbi:MAG: hypothetical protein KGO53_06340 [Alphaproteobacteria bacterium]|nr:hypothetical protein [Alphaproteobacteria bacterium]
MTRAATDQTNLSDLVKGLGRRVPLIAGLAAAGLLCGWAYISVSKPAYQTEAQVVIENLSTPFDRSTSVQEVLNTDNGVSDRMVQSQVSVIKSADINARVVDQLGLDQKPEYNSQLRSHSTLGGLAISLGFKDDPNLFTPKALAAKTLAASVTVYPVPESNTIGIKSVAGDPQLAAATANAIADTYVLSTHETGSTSNDRARTWLGKQIDELRAKVSASENAVEKYRAEAGLLKGASTTLGNQQISDLNAQITVAETAKTEAQARVNEIRNLLATRGQVDASADVLSSPLIQNLREQQTTAQRQLSELSATYLPGHPKMIAAQKQLDTVNAQVRNEALKIVDSLVGQAKIADARAASLRANLENLKGTEAEANFSDVKLKELEREAEANRTLLQNMLNRYADANARQDASLQPGFARVIQHAVAPAVPYFPKSGPIMLVSAFAGLVLGLGLAFVLELLSAPAPGAASQEESRHRRHPLQDEDIADVTVPEIDLSSLHAAFAAASAVRPAPAPKPREASAGILGAIASALSPAAAAEMLNAARLGQHSPFADAVARLAQTLEAYKKARGVSSFAFTSLDGAAPNAALATIALARTFAAKGEKVIALDISKPGSGFEALLGLSPGPGLAELVAGHADFTKIVARDVAGPLHIVRLGQSANAGTQAALATRLPAILTALKSIYTTVFLHAGEASAAAVPLLEAAGLTVIMATHTRFKDADAAAKVLEEGGATKAVILKMEPEPGGVVPGAATA